MLDPSRTGGGDASTPIADILGRSSQWAGLNAGVHVGEKVGDWFVDTTIDIGQWFD